MKLNLTCPTLFCVPFCSMRNACLLALLLVLRSCSSSSGDIGTNMFAQLQLYVDGTSSAEQGEQCASALDQLSTALNSGADADAHRNQGSTMLMYASWNGARDAVRLLLKHGARPNLTDDDGETALMAAASMGWGKIAIELLAGGADLHAANKRGQDALALARQGGYAKVVTLLEEAHSSGVEALLSKYRADLAS